MCLPVVPHACCAACHVECMPHLAGGAESSGLPTGLRADEEHLEADFTGQSPDPCVLARPEPSILSAVNLFGSNHSQKWAARRLAAFCDLCRASYVVGDSLAREYG